jgi:hypothetical protein
MATLAKQLLLDRTRYEELRQHAALVTERCPDSDLGKHMMEQRRILDATIDSIDQALKIAA